MRGSQTFAFALSLGALAMAGHTIGQQAPSPSQQPVAPAPGDPGTIDCPPMAASTPGAGTPTGGGGGGPSAPATPPRTGPMITSPATPGQPATGTPGTATPTQPSTGPMATSPTLPGQPATGSTSGPATTPTLGGSRPVEGTLNNVDVSAHTLEIGSVKLETDANTIVLVDCKRSALTDLKEGSKVKAAYQVRDGRNIATTIEVQPQR
jgi:hypothetical protein